MLKLRIVCRESTPQPTTTPTHYTTLLAVRHAGASRPLTDSGMTSGEADAAPRHTAHMASPFLITEQQRRAPAAAAAPRITLPRLSPAGAV